MEDYQEMFEEIMTEYDYQRVDEMWKTQSKTFIDFWLNKLNNENIQLSNEDFDSIIKLLDTKAKGFNQDVDDAVAATSIRQGVWYRIFNDIKKQKTLRDKLFQIFSLADDNELIKKIDELKSINEQNKNGLTGKNANALNAILFIANPRYFISSVSLNHRKQIIKYFDLGEFNDNASYGKQIVISNRLILDGFSRILTGSWSPRTIAHFLYDFKVKSLWENKTGENEPIMDVNEVDISESDFQIEKHLEDFLIANWESTTLGAQFELIEEDGELKSQQYPTTIGKIDLLVKDKQSGNYVVIELKRGQTSDDTVGQITRYMGWVKNNLTNGTDVKGIIIAGGFDERLKYSIEMVNNVKIMIYKINFTIEEV